MLWRTIGSPCKSVRRSAAAQQHGRGHETALLQDKLPYNFVFIVVREWKA